ncbi:MAG: acyl carrier protein [Clostridium sp.]|nr:MAG: acyl carrier protein [Clostridium sp.]
MNGSFFDKVKQIIINELKVDADKITPDTNLKDDLGADSLDAVEIVMALEDEFNISIPDEEIQNISTVKKLVEYIESKLN